RLRQPWRRAELEAPRALQHPPDGGRRGRPARRAPHRASARPRHLDGRHDRAGAGAPAPRARTGPGPRLHVPRARRGGRAPARVRDRAVRGHGDRQRRDADRSERARPAHVLPAPAPTGLQPVLPRPRAAAPDAAVRRRAPVRLQHGGHPRPGGGADLAVCDVRGGERGETAAAVCSLGRRALARRVGVARAEEVRAFADAVHAEHEAVDVLINNAGVGLGGGFLDTSLEDWQWILSINLWGVIHGCHFFLPPMVRRGRGGHVVNVSSAAGFLATAQLAAYSATKFAVFGLSEALREELRPHGIAVTTVCPGIINTPITTTSPMRGPLATPEV